MILATAMMAHGAQAVFVPEGSGRQDVSRHLTMLQDPTGAHSVEDVAVGGAGRFSSASSISPVSVANAVYWARLVVDFSNYKEPYSYLLLDPNAIGRIDLYYPAEAGGFESSVIDEDKHLEARALAVRSLLFKLPTPAAGPTTLYLRFEPKGLPLQTKLAWVSDETAIKEAASAHLVQGLLFGALIALILYNTFLLFTTRDRAYLLYVYYLSSFTLLMCIMTGMRPFFLWDGWTNHTFVMLNCAVIHGGVWFFRVFLRLHLHAPFLVKYFKAIQWSAVGLAISTLLGGVQFTHGLSLLLVVLAETALVVGSIVSWRQGFEPARYSTIGLVVHAAVSTAFVLQFTQVLHVPHITIYSVELACVWEALFFSFALAYRVRLAEAKARELLAEQERNIAAEHSALAKANEATAEKNTFLSMISHELRTPLQSILSGLDMLERRNIGLGNDEYVTRIRWGSNALNRQLSDLLTLSQGQAGRLEMRPELFEAVEFVQDALDRVRPAAERKNLKLELVCGSDPLFVVADPTRLNQVLHNLIDNAVKYTKSGLVRVTVALDENKWMSLCVKDTGTGIPAARLPSLFKPFRRFGELDRERTGSGIGLAVVHMVVGYLGGTLKVESEENIGSQFSVSIPVTLPDELEATPLLEAVKRVLIVDDREDVLESLRAVVLELGCECETANSAAIAANLMAARHFDVVLVDIDMPVKNGCELASDTRRGGGRNSETPLVAISASVRLEQDRSWAFDSFCQKPIDRSKLAQLINTRRIHAGAAQ